MSDYLLLKWGTYKRINAESEAMKKMVDDIDSRGLTWSLGGMHEVMTDEKKKAFCDLIDSCEGTIQNDWDGKIYTKEQAKFYIMEYRV